VDWVWVASALDMDQTLTGQKPGAFLDFLTNLTAKAKLEGTKTLPATLKTHSRGAR